MFSTFGDCISSKQDKLVERDSLWSLRKFVNFNTSCVMLSICRMKCDKLSEFKGNKHYFNKISLTVGLSHDMMNLHDTVPS